jgi:hypothetical protein
MRLADKIPMAKSAVEFITRHDDEPIEAVEAALAKLAAHVAAELEAARARRAAKAAAAVAALESQTITAADVGTVPAELLK